LPDRGALASADRQIEAGGSSPWSSSRRDPSGGISSGETAIRWWRSVWLGGDVGGFAWFTSWW